MISDNDVTEALAAGRALRAREWELDRKTRIDALAVSLSHLLAAREAHHGDDAQLVGGAIDTAIHAVRGRLCAVVTERNPHVAR